MLQKKRKNLVMSRMTQEWLDALAPLGTSWEKPFRNMPPI